MAARTGTTSPATMLSPPPVPPRLPAGVEPPLERPAGPPPPVLELGAPLPAWHAVELEPLERETRPGPAATLPLAPPAAARAAELAHELPPSDAHELEVRAPEADARSARAAGPVVVPGASVAARAAGGVVGRHPLAAPTPRERPLRGPAVVTFAWRHPRPGSRLMTVEGSNVPPERRMAQQLGRAPGLSLTPA